MFTSQGFMVDISGSSLALPWGRKEIVVLAAFLLVAWFSPNSNQLTEKFSFRYPWAIAVGVLLLVAVMNLNRITTFLYYSLFPLCAALFGAAAGGFPEGYPCRICKYRRGGHLQRADYRRIWAVLPRAALGRAY